MNYGTLVLTVAGQMASGTAVVFFVALVFDYLRSMFFPKE